MNTSYREKLADYLPIFMEYFEERLEMDELKWGDTWKHRTYNGQDERLYQEFQNYWDQYKYGNQDLPYLKIIGNVFINWVREYENREEDVEKGDK